MKTHLTILVMLTSAIFTIGCGEGEEEDAKQQEIVKTTPPTGSTSEDVTEEIIEETINTEDLISAPEFDLNSSSELQVSLPASPSATITYFINICTDFSKNENDDIEINYDSCKLRTTIALTEQSFSLSLSVAENKLIAQIWPMTNGAQPINIYWDIAESGNNWQIEF